MLNTEDIAAIGSEIKEYDPPLEITFHPSESQSAFSQSLYEVGDALATTAGKGAVLDRGEADGLHAVPALSISHPNSGTIHYMALPQGHEAAPFREMITHRIRDAVELPDELKDNLRTLRQPADIMVFIGSTCPNCPQAVRAANTLALSGTNLIVSIIDVEQFPELTERFKIRTVPMTIIDNNLMINEVISPANLARKILSRGSHENAEEIFKSQVNLDRVDEAVEWLLHHEKGARVFLSAWKKSTLSIRIGLMLVAEEALAEDSSIMNNIVGELIALLETDDISLKGDTIDLLGQIGHPDAKTPLEALLRDPNPDIAEIARESLESILGDT